MYTHREKEIYYIIIVVIEAVILSWSWGEWEGLDKGLWNLI